MTLSEPRSCFDEYSMAPELDTISTCDLELRSTMIEAPSSRTYPTLSFVSFTSTPAPASSPKNLTISRDVANVPFVHSCPWPLTRMRDTSTGLEQKTRRSTFVEMATTEPYVVA